VSSRIARDQSDEISLPAYETPGQGSGRAQVKLGRYEVVRELGKGAMGIVYLAKDPLIGRLVALKTIRPAAHADDDETREFQQRFIREAQAAGILNHPSIVTVHDIGQDEPSGTNFIAMEYVEGSNLKEVLSQGRPLTFEQIGDIVAQVAEGLDFAHAKGIVHRDVKPANIILIEGNRAKITDFGIAKIASGGANLTTTGQFLGTPNYMAPEQIKGAPVDGRTDIFSLGICLYECLTRRKPFGGDSLTSISYKIVHEPFPPLQEINPQIPSGYEEVVAKCLAKDPAKRFQRARDAAAALRAVIRGERPQMHEPAAAEETIVTRDSHKIPTIEIPFPDAVEAPVLDTNPHGVADAAAAPAAPKAAPKPKRAGPAAPVLRRRIHPIVFIAIVVVLIGALAAAVLSIRHKAVPQRTVDVKAEKQVAYERQLRQQANELLKQGRVTDAYAKFAELKRLAPNSPAVTAMMQRLDAMRAQEEIGRQQLANAKAKFDQGVALYNQKKFAEAIPLLSESFSLNPNSEQTASYLKLAQQEQQKVDDANEQARQQRRLAATSTQPRPGVLPTGTHPTTAGGDGGHNGVPAASAPVQFTTTFNSPYTDGYVMVKVGADIVVREQIWEERGRLMFRRKYPRNVNVLTNITPKNADIEVWVVVPSLKIQEHHVLPRVNLQPGSSHRLTITSDATSKKFDYSIN
jgi:predicted Ser/Thr protein kinase/outer membrane protein assembly factor BamD (BamD/ComL family)